MGCRYNNWWINLCGEGLDACRSDMQNCNIASNRCYEVGGYCHAFGLKKRYESCKISGVYCMKSGDECGEGNCDKAKIYHRLAKNSCGI